MIADLIDVICAYLSFIQLAFSCVQGFLLYGALVACYIWAMKAINKELIVLRSFAAVAAGGIILLSSLAFRSSGPQQFDEITVHRINIVEPDGTVKMVITNADKFPNGENKLNGRTLTKSRKKRSGMLYFNEDGIECGGFIYDGQKKTDGHSAGMSLTYDQYDGDQVYAIAYHG